LETVPMPENIAEPILPSFFPLFLGTGIQESQ